VKRFRNNIAVCCEALGKGVSDAPSVYVDDRHECAAGLPGHCGDEETYCAGTNYESGGAGGGGGAVEGVDRHGEWLEEGCCVEGYMVWDSVRDVSD
jgi:hypothetical protein